MRYHFKIATEECRFPEREDNFGLQQHGRNTAIFVVAGEMMRQEASHITHITHEQPPRQARQAFIINVIDRAHFTIRWFEENDDACEDGAPVIQENGLISVVPSHLWTARWSDDAKFGGAREFSKPKFFLPEINALWIKMLLREDVQIHS